MHTLADLWAVILGMAVVTYATRVGGLWLVSLADQTPRLARLLGHLATGVLTALVVSGLHAGDLALAAAALAALVLMYATGQYLAALAGAAMVAALIRAWLS